MKFLYDNWKDSDDAKSWSSTWSNPEWWDPWLVTKRAWKHTHTLTHTPTHRLWPHLSLSCSSRLVKSSLLFMKSVCLRFSLSSSMTVRRWHFSASSSCSSIRLYVSFCFSSRRSNWRETRQHSLSTTNSHSDTTSAGPLATLRVMLWGNNEQRDSLHTIMSFIHTVHSLQTSLSIDNHIFNKKPKQKIWF